jgi:hypothetical protein
LSTLAEMRQLAQKLQQRWRRHALSVHGALVIAREDPGLCPQCQGPMHVEKTLVRTGATLTLGAFLVRETVHVCASRCRRPSGALVTRRAQALQESILPRRSIGYDVMVYIGVKRYLEYLQREEIQRLLRDEHRISLSTGTISDLARLFGSYLRALHEDRADALREALEGDGGWPLHVDATGENGRGTLLIAYAGWRRWVLGAWKIPTERADMVLPRLREVVALFGAPCAIVRDLGRAMTQAANDLVTELEHPIPVLACHAHFLADVGNDLLDPSHSALRNLFRRHKIRPALRGMAREIGRTIGSSITRVRKVVLAWQQDPNGEHTLPKGHLEGLGIVRALAQWVLDYPDDASGADFPFDRPYLDLLDRCLHARRAVDAFLRRPPDDKKVCHALKRLGRALEPAATQAPFAETARTLRSRAKLFDDLRSALRLSPSGSGGHTTEAAASQHELRTIQSAVEQLTLSLRERRPSRGPAQDSRQAIDLVLAHLHRHGDSLWGHAIPLPHEAGGGVRVVSRTNNLLEGLNRSLKQGERRRSGRRVLADDFEHLPSEAALAPNLRCDDYLQILCTSLEQLPRAFADLDQRRRLTAVSLPPHDTSLPTPELASASLPKADRCLIRSDDMNRRVLAAARSRAPHVHTAPQPC